jgi:aspartate 1-decarboxylase
MNTLILRFNKQISKTVIFGLLCSLLTLAMGTLQVTQAPSASAATGDTGSIEFSSAGTTNSSNHLKLDTLNSAFAMGTGDFAIELWWRPTASQRSDVFNMYDSTSELNRLDIGYGLTQGSVELYLSNCSTIGSGVGIGTIMNQWTHLAATRSAGTIRFFINGVEKGSTSCNKNMSSSGGTGYKLSIMGDGPNTSNGSGNVTNIRVVKGSALYTSNFTVPTSPLQKISGTVFLLSAIQGSTFAQDSSDSNITLTSRGTPISSSLTPFPESAPTISSASISGTAKYGETLTAAAVGAGGNPNPTSTYQWYRGGTPISGATASTYVTGASDLGAQLSVQVTVTNRNGTASATSSSTAAIGKATPIIGAWNSNWRTRTYGNPTFSLEEATANVPGTFAYTSDSSSVISLNGRTATVAGAGSAIITASFTPTDTTNYESSASTSLSFTVLKNTPTLTWSNFSKYLGDASFTLTPPTAPTPGTFTYASATPSVISLSGDVATVVGVGTSVITANFTPTDTNNYGTSSKTITVTVNPTAQTITRTSVSPTSPVKSETYTPTATASSSLTVAISIASGSSSVCSISAGVVTFNTVGSCVIQYNQSGNGSYSAATQVTETLTIGKMTPSLTWSNASKTFGDSAFTVTAPTVTGSIGGSFSYSSGDTSVISISGSTFTVAGAGASVITATFTPTDSTNYNSVTTTMTVTVGIRSQTITRTSTSPTSPLKSGTYTPAATSSSSLAVSIAIASASASVCSISAGVVTFNTVGSCVILYNQAGNANYAAATQVTETLSIGQDVPTFTWAGVSKIYGETFSLTAPTPSTPGTFTYSSATTSVVIISSSTTTIVGNGTSVITATFTPNDTTNYVSGGTVTMTISADRAAITVTPTAGQSKVYGENNPTITYSVTSGALVGSDVLSGALTYTGSNVGTYPISIGTLANSKYIITLASVNFSITKATQAAVTLSSLSSVFTPSNKTVSLTGTGGTGTGSYQYALDSSNTTAGCSVTGSTLTYTTAGTCVVAVTRTADSNYLARTDAVSFSIGLASQTITFGSLSAKSYSSDTFTVSATSSASLTVVFTSASPSICTTSGNSGSTITLLNVGTCVINANQIGDSNVAAASQVSQNFTVNPRAITVTADAKTKAFGATDPIFTYTITTGSLVLGDAITGTLARVSGSDVGTYQIQAGTLTSANNPKYSVTFTGANLTITRATPVLVLTYPNSNVAILRPGATDTPTVTTSSSAGALTFATSASSSICTVDATTGVISLLGAGSCAVAMSTAQTTNFIAFTETTTVTVALLSTSLVGINSAHLVSMGQPFFSHASIDQSYSFSSGSNGASVAIPAGTLDPAVPISINLLTDSADQRAIIGGTGTSVLSVVVSWVASDGSVPTTNAGKAIAVTLTNPAIKSGARIYSIIGNQSTLLGTATTDGSVTTLITEDPVLLVINPAVAPQIVSSPVDNSAAIAAAQAKMEAEKQAAALKAEEEKKLAAEAEAAALKVAAELADAKAKANAELKAAADKAAAEIRIAEELRIAQLKAEEELKLAAEKKAAEDAALAAKAAKPAVTLYSVSPTLKLNAYNTAYLQKYVKSLKNGAAVTCIGYSYSKNTTLKKATALAKSQATAVCTLMKKTNKTLKTSVVVYPSTKAPKAAMGAKWVGVSYRIDGFKN